VLGGIVAGMTGAVVRLSRSAASQAVEAIGWRYLLETLAASVPVTSLADAGSVAAAAIAACGAEADAHVRVDLRPDRVELSVQTRALGAVTSRDAELAERITDAVRAIGHRTGGATSAGRARPVQSLEIAIDAADIPAVRPFWKAVLGYVGEAGRDGPEDSLVDPAGQLPAVWFQRMDTPRSQRNCIHLDVTVPHDEADARVRAALAAGGVLVSDARARAFWVLADCEGNEVCVCTWLDRDDLVPLI
jgi:4a-hydroxytetrahydrobiopterin dehydratase